VLLCHWGPTAYSCLLYQQGICCCIIIILVVVAAAALLVITARLYLNPPQAPSTLHKLPLRADTNPRVPDAGVPLDCAVLAPPWQRGEVKGFHHGHSIDSSPPQRYRHHRPAGETVPTTVGCWRDPLAMNVSPCRQCSRSAVLLRRKIETTLNAPPFFCHCDPAAFRALLMRFRLPMQLTFIYLLSLAPS
jgi:hypothetical protein